MEWTDLPGYAKSKSSRCESVSFRAIPVHHPMIWEVTKPIEGGVIMASYQAPSSQNDEGAIQTSQRKKASTKYSWSTNHALPDYSLTSLGKLGKWTHPGLFTYHALHMAKVWSKPLGQGYWTPIASHRLGDSETLNGGEMLHLWMQFDPSFDIEWSGQ